LTVSPAWQDVVLLRRMTTTAMELNTLFNTVLILC